MSIKTYQRRGGGVFHDSDLFTVGIRPRQFSGSELRRRAHFHRPMIRRLNAPQLNLIDSFGLHKY